VAAPEDRMSVLVSDVENETLDLDRLPLDEERGTMGMAMFIATEAALFVCLLFAYFYTGHAHPPWPPHLPKIAMPLVMLGVLGVSSITVQVAVSAVRKQALVRARVMTAVTVLLGAMFIGLQVSEYLKKWSELRPTTNSYGSLFYVITGFHGLHVVMGLLMLLFVLVLPKPGSSDRPPHHALHNASLYWHFVDVVWLVLVVVLYLLPRVQG
jgi:cytochrome c oxidase subunit 3